VFVGEFQKKCSQLNLGFYPFLTQTNCFPSVFLLQKVDSEIVLCYNLNYNTFDFKIAEFLCLI